jgi:hypothetical protein
MEDVQMAVFDFRTVPDGSPLPLQERDFLFGVSGAASASVGPDGISCGQKAVLQLTVSANVVELTVVNGAGTAVIKAWFFGPTGWQLGGTELVPSAPGVRLVRFDFQGILRITFESMGELYLQTIQ